MIIWQTNTDRFEDGEWWRGRIYEDKCGLSPDGRLFVYFGYQWKPRYVPEGVFAFTAVSRPPHFKPVALWPTGDTWGGGGYFPDNKRLVMNYRTSSLPQPHPSYRPQGFVAEGLPSCSTDTRPNLAFLIDLAEYPGADWCGPCRKAIPELNALHKKFGDKLVVIGLSDEPEAKVKAMTTPKMDYAVAIDTQARTKKAVGVTGMRPLIPSMPGSVLSINTRSG